ncbi:class I SAM-dependent methyltransferase [bacterium]|nr:class I SAM-dependent methyltransferase [bacterium]RQV92068.1 MAG: class I SAM-dependent methyltransferase [bacterium]
MNRGDQQSNQTHWEHYWENKKEVGEIYSNGDRLVVQILRSTQVKNKRILEVGAGTGRDGFRLADAGARVFFLDYADRSLAFIKKQIQDNGKSAYLIRADARALPFRSTCFDVVFHQGLLEHFRNPEVLLRENHRVLQKDGICLVDVPQKYHIYTVIKHVLMILHAWFAGWETEFSVRRLRQLVQDAGFRIDVFYGDWMRPGLIYRIVRELLLRIGIRLPMYPKGFKISQLIRTKIRILLSRYPLFLNTYLDIGVVAKKS